MNRFYNPALLGALALITSAPCLAAPSVINQGPNLTTGASSNTQSIFSARLNPALASLTIDETENWRMNYLPSFAIGAEIGDVTNFVEELDQLIDILDDPSQAEDSAEATVEHFNEVLAEMGEQGYIRLQTGLTAPLLPLYWRPRMFPGTLSAEVEVNTQIHMSILDDELIFDDQNFNFATATSAYIKSGIEKRLSFAYSSEIDNDYTLQHFGAQMFAGIKLNIINMELSKQVMRLQQLDGRNIENVIEDEYENNLESSTALGLDAGLVLAASRYRLGLTVTDINSPSFDYGTIGEECAQYNEGSIQRNNCEAAAFFINSEGRIKANETHVKHPVATADVAFFPLKSLALSGSMDLASYDDIIGAQNQWLNYSLSYNPENFWIPAARLGYRKNMAGSKISSLAAGLTLFGVVSLDAEMSLDEVTVDGQSAPRKFAFALSVSENF